MLKSDSFDLRIILLGFFLSFHLLACEPRCENHSFELKMTYSNDQGQLFEPIFNKVYSPYAEGNLIENSTLEYIPIDLSRDTTILIFDFGDQIDTLAFSYNRVLNAGSRNKGYCMILSSERLLAQTSFSSTSLIFESLRDENYQVIIRY